MKRRLSAGSSAVKKAKPSENFKEYYQPNPLYYPNPISWKDANNFNNGKRSKPITLLNAFISGKQKMNSQLETVVHWFRCDLRVQDNSALSNALKHLETARKANKGADLVALFVINEDDWRAHLESGWKLKFILNAVANLRKSLALMNVPLVVKIFNHKERKLSNTNEFADWFKSVCLSLSKNSSTLVTTNAQYEYDEIDRDLRISKRVDEKFSFQIYHDQCVVEPGTLTTGKGSQYTVFTPWYKKWVQYLDTHKKSNDIIDVKTVSKDAKVNKELKAFDSDDYGLPKEFTSYLQDTKLDVPPANEEDALKLLEEFIESGKIGNYNDKKDILSLDNTSHLSVYITNGLISTRTVVNRCFHANDDSLMHKDIKQNNSMETFIKEVAWRDFYRHVMCNWPYLSMELAFKFETMDIRWENDEEKYRKWCLGETGLPIVDAIMRKLLHTGYINNRSRMIVASFLTKNLLVDWRWGERWFRKHLLDADLSSNSGGWGFCSSTGVDAQPFFRIFNMKLQSEKYDPKAKFIKNWIPELRDVANPHLLHESGSHVNIKGYPKPIVDLKESRDKALELYREAI
ncbi:LAFE_0H13322g1_1 [Lachancea fermentati]|uniref:LAFE_0H13322g1_1 n=1 Tax=Lachancea fermentati TaxID=4955 RepID=A0A1G4MKL8_LACFM|nr:LAFE_0H13322g1_1 [Lachancea fermentati]